MIELKLRAWDEKNKVMAYQGEPDLETLQSFVFHYGGCVVSWWTGFKDKNGKEIFGGDVLRHEFDADGEVGLAFCKVYFCEKMGAWLLDNSYGRDMSSGDLLSEELAEYEYEVWGNVFEGWVEGL
jgi:hypothetical protein